MGLEAKMKQYEVGEKFIEAIEAQSPGAIDDLFAAMKSNSTGTEIALARSEMNMIAPFRTPIKRTA